MADSKVEIEIATSATGTGAADTQAAIADLAKDTTQASAASESTAEGLDKVAGKKGALDKVAEGLAKNLSESIGLTGETATAFEAMAARALAAIGPVGLAIGAVALGSKLYIDSIKKETAAADEAGYALKSRSDEELQFYKNASNTLTVLKRRQELERELADLQQKTVEDQTSGAKKLSDSDKATLANKEQLLKNLISAGVAEEKRRAQLGITASLEKQAAKDSQEYSKAKIKAAADEAAAQVKIQNEIKKTKGLIDDGLETLQPLNEKRSDLEGKRDAEFKRPLTGAGDLLNRNVAVADFDQKIKDLDVSITYVYTKISNAGIALDTLNSQVKTLPNALDASESTVKANIDSAIAEVKGTAEKRGATLSQSLDTLEQKVASQTREDAGKVDASANASKLTISSQSDELQSKLDQRNKEAETKAATAAQAAKAIVDVTAKITDEGFQKVLAQIEAQSSSTLTGLNALAAGLASQKAYFDQQIADVIRRIRRPAPGR